MSDPGRRARDALNRLAGDLPAIGVALSGGGDSVALLHLVANWAEGRRVMAATVDHGLRAESRAEAEAAGALCARLGIPHDILIWRDNDGPGNLMAKAREARLQLLGDWARRNDLPAVLLGHTRDDQAETVLMRLARGAGVDGLSGMAEARVTGGVRWIRPLLQISRAELRHYLRTHAIGWSDDPSNQDPGFGRIRMRQGMDALAGLGITPERLMQTATALSAAREALRHHAAAAASDALCDNVALRLNATRFHTQPRETRRRLLIAGIRFVTGAGYAPRQSSLDHLLDAIAQGRSTTLDGTMIQPQARHLHIIREPAAALRAAATAPGAWDGRWQVDGPEAEIRALGYWPLPALNWREAGLSYHEAAASPGLWTGEKLLAAPLITRSDWQARPLRRTADFHAMLFLH